jgi:hypothetical protein
LEKEAITFLGVGDVLIDREQPETIFKHVADVLRSGDITFTNCELIPILGTFPPSFTLVLI